MESKELRIGNLVTYYGRVVSITGITEEHPFINMITADYLEWDEIEPIPLSKEWFERFGYYNENRPNHFIKDEMTIDEHTFWDCNGIFIDDKNGVCIKYVHQLQNLYFALVGKELTIKNQE